MKQDKWFKNDDNLQVGDFIMFLKDDSKISKTYKYGMIDEVHQGTDGVVRRVTVKYRNANEETFRYTNRSARSIVAIHKVDESCIMNELSSMSKFIMT